VSTLFLVHAHPDDESISTGGVMMRAREAGHRVVLVTCTRGEEGEIHNLDPDLVRPRLGQVRTQELEAAGRILGVDRLEFLGYRDSGMAGTPANQDPRSFHQAPPAEAAERLARLLREERPAVVITENADGTYGHPDHVQAHRTTLAALDLLAKEGWSPPKLYFTAVRRELLEEFRKQMPEDAARFPIAGTPEREITAFVDVRPYLERKRRAFAAHLTQNDPNSPLTTMAAQIYELAFGTECFVLGRGQAAGHPESDLFAGVDSAQA